MSTLSDNLDLIYEEKRSKIIPENIKKDVKIFDVTGTYEGQVINNQDKTITENGTYQADTGYTGLGTVTVNVSGGGGSGDVKLFETEQEMQADTDSQEGDLAVVYRTEIQNWQEETEAQIINFPDTVTLPQAFTDSIYGMFRGTDESMWFDAQMQLSASMFDFTAYGEEMIRVRYTSSDGITYTKTSGDNTVDCGTPIIWEPYEEWNDAIGYFMQIGGKYFEGLYEYKTNLENNSYVSFKPGNYLTVTSKIENNYICLDTVTTNPDIDIFNIPAYNINDLVTMLNRIKTEQSLLGTDYFILGEVNNSIIAYYTAGQNYPVYDNNGSYVGTFLYSSPQTIQKYSIDLVNNTYASDGTETTTLLGKNNIYGIPASALGNKFSVLMNYQGTGIYRG